MEKLIKFGVFGHDIMSVQRKSLGGQEDLALLVDRVLSQAREGKNPLTLFYDGKDSYEIGREGIKHYWKSHYANGTPITESASLSREEFMDWLIQQPPMVQQQVQQNLALYVPGGSSKEAAQSQDNILRY